MSRDIFFSSDAEVQPFAAEISKPTKPTKPSDELALIAVAPNTIWYLSIIKPHTDSHETVGPVKAFRHLLPRIEEIVSNSPNAIDKLEILKEKESMMFEEDDEDDGDKEKELDEEFIEKGVEIFVVEGQRGSYTVLKITREINKEVYDMLPAPVYTIISAGPLSHAPLPSKSTDTSSPSSPSFTPISLSSKFTASSPKGYASTTALHASYTDRAAAKEDAKHIFTVLLLDAGEDEVKRIQRWEKGSKGGGVLIGMSARAMWEVRVVYVDDPVGRRMEMEQVERGSAFVL